MLTNILSRITNIPKDKLLEIRSMHPNSRYRYIWAALNAKPVRKVAKVSDTTQIPISKKSSPVTIREDPEEFVEVQIDERQKKLNAYLPDFRGLDDLYEGTKVYLLKRDNKRKDPFYWKEHPPVGHFKAALNILNKIVEEDRFTLKQIYSLIGFIYYGVYYRLYGKE